jgi:hypothetical protein
VINTKERNEQAGAAPEARAPHPWLLGLSTATAVCVAYLLMVGLSWGQIADRSLYSNLGMIPIGVAATVVAASAGTMRNDARSAWAWRLIAAAFACFCAGDILYFFYQNVLGRSPFPSVADAGYLLYYPLMLVGLLTLRRERRGKGRPMWLRMAGGASLLLAGGASVIVWFLLPTFQSWDGGSFAFFLSVGYPLGDLLLVGGVSWMIVRRVVGRTVTQSLIMSGVCVGLVADVIYGYQSIHGISQPGGVSDALFMVSWALYAWAAYTEATRRQPSRRHWEGSK